RQDLGAIAGDLLRMLEYRGYDSTGAAIQAEGPEVQLRKGVGAPSVMVERLGIVDLPGQILCAQVRWATFGAVNDENSQPHLVRCETYLYGAHNGNVTNCDELAGWLRSLGHRIVSDNDGEMVVHTVEHFFAAQLEALPEEARQEQAPRRAAMREALVQAAARLRGSYAAVIVDPIARTVWAIKAGSSLYLGVGEDAVGGRYALVSSDLSSVLRMTRILVPLAAGEAVEVDPSGVRLWSLRGEGAPLELERAPARSRLRAKDAALMPPFESFMDQEIHAQEEACRDVLRIFQGGSPASRLVGPFIDMMTDDELEQARDQVDHLLDQYEDDAIAQAFAELMRDPSFRTLQGRMPAELRREASEADELELAGRSLADSFHSAELGFFADLLARARTAEERLAVRLLDAWLEREEVGEYMDAVAAFSQLCIETMDRGSRIYIVCCGTSFHAAKAASLFFSELARTEVLPLLPGEFRGQHAATLRDGDLLVAVSQSGETKDLIDVIDMAMASGRRITRVGLVNNVNSTLAQEKSDVVIPLRCGPEIAVPATKSFMNQLTVFYCLAVRLAERRITTRHVIEGQAGGEELSERNLRLPALPELVRRTIEQTEGPVEEAAELVYLAPSMHLLATRLLAVAKEGALKIREVVLNHTEGFEASEFKHGPNTILGFNTLFGPRQVHAMLETLGEGLG
ncbi:MAG: SIS domain-containing protein, partial [Myxococcales bacterium]|nr:SIS domain-containing protein [Myxococcales bacterium]